VSTAPAGAGWSTPELGLVALERLARFPGSGLGFIRRCLRRASVAGFWGGAGRQPKPKAHLRRRVQTRDVGLDLSPNRGLKVFVSLARFLPQPVVGLKPAQGDLKPGWESEPGSGEQPPKKVIRRPLFSLRYVEGYPRVRSEKFGVNHALVLVVRTTECADSGQLLTQIIRQ